MIDEACALEIAKRAVAAKESWADRATYEARREADRWVVSVQRIEGYTADGAPLHVRGGHRLYVLDKEGHVARHIPGR
jgi:hypothetical protein